MANLPTVGGDNGTWGTVLNEYLTVEHNSDGTHDPGVDTTAVHDNVSAEISAVTEKTTPVDNDLILIEDSAASNAKKRLKVGNLPFSKGVLASVNDVTTRQYTGNNTWETVSSTEISFVANKTKHKISVTFTYRYDRGGFWQILLSRIAGTNLGTTTPTQYVTEYFESAYWPTTSRHTVTVVFTVEPTIGNTVTLHLETNNSNTSNYITYFHTFVVAD